MKFDTKVMILKALRFPKAMCSTVDLVRKIRNRFAHSKEVSFSDFESNITACAQNHGIKHPVSISDSTVELNRDGKSTIYEFKTMSIGNQLLYIAIIISTVIAVSTEVMEFPEPILREAN